MRQKSGPGKAPAEQVLNAAIPVPPQGEVTVEELALIMGNADRAHYGQPALKTIQGEGWANVRAQARALLATHVITKRGE